MTDIAGPLAPKYEIPQCYVDAQGKWQVRFADAQFIFADENTARACAEKLVKMRRAAHPSSCRGGLAPPHGGPYLDNLSPPGFIGERFGKYRWAVEETLQNVGYRQSRTVVTAGYVQECRTIGELFDDLIGDRNFTFFSQPIAMHPDVYSQLWAYECARGGAGQFWAGPTIGYAAKGYHPLAVECYTDNRGGPWAKVSSPIIRCRAYPNLPDVEISLIWEYSKQTCSYHSQWPDGRELTVQRHGKKFRLHVPGGYARMPESKKCTRKYMYALAVELWQWKQVKIASDAALSRFRLWAWKTFEYA